MTKSTAIVLGAVLSAFAAHVRAAETESSSRFDVLEYRVLGNSVLPSIDIERTLYPLLGTGKELADVEQARSTLENLYRAAGYGTVFVDIPEQDTAEGIIRLKVTEGRLQRTTVSGARYFSGREIKAALPEAAPGEVPHLPTLQTELAALNTQTSDRVVTPALKPGPSPGTMALALNVQDTLPLHGRFELNDQYSINTSRLRATAALNYDNLFDRLDSLSLQFQTAPEEISESKVWAFSYTARLPDPRSRLSAFYIKSDSNVANVGEGGAPLQVLGRGDIYGLRYIRTLVSQAESTHLLVAGLEYKDFNEIIPRFADPGDETDPDDPADTQTPISYLNLSLGHMSSWRQPQTQWSLSSTANFGLRGSINRSAEFARKRYRGKPNYIFLREDGSMQRALPWGASLRLRAGGQYARDSIISNEQYSIAGADGVRGYLEAEVLGDVAIKGSLELAAPDWQLGQIMGQAFLFYDYGRMKRVHPLKTIDAETGELELLEPAHVQLSSIGAGLSLSFTRYIAADLTWARALDDSPADGGTRAHHPRLQFGVRSTW